MVNQGDATISTYDVDSAGALTFASSVDTEQQDPVQIVLSPDGASAYVTNYTSGSVSQFDVSAAGVLSPKQPSAVDAGGQAAGIAVSPDGASVYVTNQAPNGTVTQFSVAAASGNLTPKADPVDAGSGPRAIVAVADRVYVANVAGHSVSQYTADADGALSELASPVATSRSPFALALSPNGRSLYAASYTDAVLDQYDVAGDGTLAAKAGLPVPASSHPQAVVAVLPRDEQAPTIDLRTPEEGAQYDLGADVRADYSCADEGGSGLASCTGDVADGAPLDTSTPGAHAFTVLARDGAGNETTVTHGYTVTESVLAFKGFFGPIHNGSIVRAGDAIPIVFSLGGYGGLNVLADGSPSSVRVDCRHPGQATGGERALSKSGRGLRFNRSTGHYVFTWQTKSAWAGTCRTFVLDLRDGSVARLTVSFPSAWRWHRHR